jgi:type I restriction enzyme R subunit
MAGSNFSFLGRYDTRLAQFGLLAERYYRADPPTSIVKVRQFAELLAKLIAARQAIYRGENETFEETLRRLSYERIIPREVADIFHALRKAGNVAVHEAKGNHASALTSLKFARSLGVWFHDTYGDGLDLHIEPFAPPSDLADVTAPLRAEIDVLRQKVIATETAAEIERRKAEERLLLETEERATWERLAQQIEEEKGEISAKLAALQVEAEAAPKGETLALIERGAEAATKIDLDEAETRALIDQQLRDRGWEADTKLLRHGGGVRPAKGRNMAIAEWPTESGPADYALFVGATLIGVVEAKRKRKNVSAAIDQAERYSFGIKDRAGSAYAGGPWGEHRVPFVFAANGRSYLRQIETESGIWFRDTRRAANHRRALVDWPTPDGLIGLLEFDHDAADAALRVRLPAAPLSGSCNPLCRGGIVR